MLTGDQSSLIVGRIHPIPEYVVLLSVFSCADLANS